MVTFCVAILILKMDENKQHFWHIMLYYFMKCKMQLKDKKEKDLCSEERRCCDWSNVAKVVCGNCAGDFSLDDAWQMGRPVEADSNQIKTLLENNQCYTTQKTAIILQISKSSIENHLQQRGDVHLCDVWVPHK